jgi:tetratricopeptide (TPR) repeat protein
MRSASLLLIAFALCAPGCAPRAKMMVLRPAELDVAGIGRIAVVDFQGEGDSGAFARSAVLAQLAENRHYTLVDQTELARVQPAAFAEGTPTEAAAVAAARQAGVDAILTGQVVSYSAEDTVQQDQHISIAGAGGASTSGSKAGGFGIGLDTNTLHERDASVSLAFKLIDARTGEIRDARQVSHTYQNRVVNGQGEMPGREKILSDLLRKCSQDVVAAVAPHRVPVEAVLARQYWGNGLNALKRGNSLAKSGDWTAAEAAWQEALKDNPQNHAAHHNLALACEARGDFDGAARHLSQAMKHYAATLYHQTGERIAAERRDQAAAQAQIAAKPRMLPPANALAPASPAFPPQNSLPTNIIPAGFVSGGEPMLERLPPPDVVSPVPAPGTN